MSKLKYKYTFYRDEAKQKTFSSLLSVKTYLNKQLNLTEEELSLALFNLEVIGSCYFIQGNKQITIKKKLHIEG